MGIERRRLSVMLVQLLLLLCGRNDTLFQFHSGCFIFLPSISDFPFYIEALPHFSERKIMPPADVKKQQKGRNHAVFKELF